MTENRYRGDDDVMLAVDDYLINMMKIFFPMGSKLCNTIGKPTKVDYIEKQASLALILRDYLGEIWPAIYK